MTYNVKHSCTDDMLEEILEEDKTSLYNHIIYWVLLFACFGLLTGHWTVG